MKKRLLSLLLVLSMVLCFGLNAMAAGDAEPADTGAADTEPVDAEASDVETGATETADTEAGDAETADAEPVAIGSAAVEVTIAVAGEAVLSAMPVQVSDMDQDGALTINDALICTHARYCPAGVEGYASVASDYGLSLTELWNVDNGGAYGYFLNDASAWSLADPVKTGDYIVAFTYADTEGYSDQYCFFSSRKVSAMTGSELLMTLSAQGYDAEWNPVTVPVSGATLTINGDATEYVTDENGQVRVTLPSEIGEYTVSATSETAVLVPPLALVSLSSLADVCGSWAETEINEMLASGLMTGKGTKFDLKSPMSRGQIAQVLYRMANSPETEGACPFTDVKPGAYYEKAVVWAASLGIITGTDATTFAPDKPATRQQIATFLYRYAQMGMSGISVSDVESNILSYTDAADVSEYAIPAMQWACGMGVMNGTDGKLLPAKTATRAEAAVMLYRFTQLKAK